MAKKKVDVCLVLPPSEDTRMVLASLGLASISAVLKREGLSVEIIHYSSITGRSVSRRILDRIKQLSPSIVGLHVISGNYLAAKFITEELSNQRKKPCIVWGGHLPSMLPESVLVHTNGIDYLIMGYGENSFLELSQKLLAGENVDGIDGLASKGNITTETPSYVGFRGLP